MLPLNNIISMVWEGRSYYHHNQNQLQNGFKGIFTKANYFPSNFSPHLLHLIYHPEKKNQNSFLYLKTFKGAYVLIF